MHKLIMYLTGLGTAFCFVLSFPILQVLGWSILDGNNLTKIHPAFYVLMATAGLALLSNRSAYLKALKSPEMIFYSLATVLLFGRALAIAASGVTGGEFTAVLVTWVTPIALLICYAGFSERDLDRFGTAIRAFFVVNSLMGLTERLLGEVFFSGVLLGGISDTRACALLGHPLNSSMLTGIMIIYLVTAPRRGASVAARLPEILLHGLAMFAFGGRTALVFTVAVLLFSGIVARQGKGEGDRVSIAQRMIPILVLFAGVLLIFLPIPFVDHTLERFSNDSGSASTRDAAISMLQMMTPNEMLWGIDANRRAILMDFFHTPYGIELAWIAMILVYGIVVTLPMLFALLFLIYRVTAPLDRSARYMALQFLLVSAGSLSIASKTVTLTLLFAMILTLSRRRARTASEGDDLFKAVMRSQNRGLSA